MDAVGDGGGGVFIAFPDDHQEMLRLPTGVFCSKYMAEAQDLEQAASWSTASVLGFIGFCSSPMSVLQALGRGKLLDLGDELSRVAADGHAVLQWLPSHCDEP